VSLPVRFEPGPPEPSAMEGRLARVEAKLDAALEDRTARVEGVEVKLDAALEDRLARVEERATEYAAFAGDISVRMARLEALLTQLVGSHVTTS
jgi:hypothetical protein